MFALRELGQSCAPPPVLFGALSLAFLEQRGAMSFDGAISSMGKTRDDDGTVDRVADPPQRLWAVLAAFKYKCEVENIEIISVFEVCQRALCVCVCAEWRAARGTRPASRRSRRWRPPPRSSARLAARGVAGGRWQPLWRHEDLQLLLGAQG